MGDMATEEEDYMSDSLLAGTTDVRPGLLFNRSAKRTHEMLKKKEKYGKKPRTYAEKEKEVRDIGLDTPISTKNKGFQLLIKMGFKPGEKIGTNKDADVGLNEPIKVVTKDTKTGLGHDSEIAEKEKIILQKQNQSSHNLLNEFRENAIKRKLERLTARDYNKAQRMCKNLDSSNGVTEPVHPWYWPKKKDTDKNIDDSDSSSEEEEEEEGEEPPYIPDMPEKLQKILMHLRNDHIYCMYCAIKFESDADLQGNCPGITREDHDDDDD